jgi:hypothetical protein
MRLAAFLVCSVFIVGCSGSETSKTAPAAAAPSVGVFAETDHGLVPLSAFGLKLSSTLPVRNTPMSVPNVGPVTQFVINVPNTRAADAKVYWVPNLNLIFANNIEPLPVETAAGSHGETTLTCSSLAGHTNGYAALVLKMPEGSLDRMYAVALSPKGQASGG